MVAPQVTVPEAPAKPRPRWITVLWWGDGIAAAGGVLGVLLGRLWTVPVELCDRTHGTMGHPVLWASSLTGLTIAVLVVPVALVLGVVSLVRRDRSAAAGAGVAVLGAVAAGTACVGGVILAMGDAPVFCF
jgi:hypothetical protein